MEEHIRVPSQNWPTKDYSPNCFLRSLANCFQAFEIYLKTNIILPNKYPRLEQAECHCLGVRLSRN